MVREPAQRSCLQELEVRDLGGKFLEATLPVGDLCSEQILMVAIECLAIQIFIGSVSKRNCGARQHILDPPVKARLFLLCLVQRMFDCSQNGPDARAIGFSVPVYRAGSEGSIVASSSKVVVRAGSQKKLKHCGMSG